MSKTVLFVCTGNVCRSPIAAALFNREAVRAGEGDLYKASSAGTWALERQPASGHALTVMAQRGIDLSSHYGHTITEADLDKSDSVIVMTRSHRDALAAEFPSYRRKLHLMSELQARAYDIGDPYGGSLADYEHCTNELERLIHSGYSQIKAWMSTDVS